MDKIEKFVRKLGKSRAIDVKQIIRRIAVNDLVGMDVRKLKGEDAKYRVRVGKIRIKFVPMEQGNLIFDIDFRNDNTY